MFKKNLTLKLGKFVRRNFEKENEEMKMDNKSLKEENKKNGKIIENLLSKRECICETGIEKSTKIIEDQKRENEKLRNRFDGLFKELDDYRKKNGAQVVNIRVSPNETVQHAINMYKLKTNTTEKDDEIKFIFNGKQLNYSLTLAASGLSDASKITVISTKDVEGAF